MSTIKSIYLQHLNGTTPNATMDPNGNFTVGGTVSGASSNMFRNRIINGDMRIAQRATSASVTGGGYFVVDRWRWTQADGYGAIITPTISQDSSTPSSFIGNSLKFTVGTGSSPTSTNAAALEQYIEGFNTADFAFGTAAAATTTLSFWVRASLTGTYCVFLRNGSTRSIVKEYTINTANTWEYKTITISGDTSGTWVGATNGLGLGVGFCLGSGTSYETTAGTWASGQYFGTTNQTDLTATTGATFYITGVQLEVGTTATPFEFRPYGQELALCQRYYYKLGPNPVTTDSVFCNGFCDSTTNFVGSITHPVPMRVAPALTTTGTPSDYSIRFAGSNVSNATSIPVLYGNATNIFGARMDTGSSSLVTGYGAHLRNATTAGFLAFNAEL